MGSNGRSGRRTFSNALWFCSFAVFTALVPGCDATDPVRGSVFVSGVKDFSGKTTGVAIDFVPAQHDMDLTLVALEFSATTSFGVGGEATTHACLHLPTSGRRTLNASTPELMSDTRVTVIAKRRTVEWVNESDHGTAGGGAGAAGSAATGSSDKGTGGSWSAGFCSGTYIDDAVWPSVGASVPPAPPTGGASGSGGAAGNAATGGMSGSAGESAGGMPDVGGAGDGPVSGTGGSGGGSGGLGGSAGGTGEAGTGGVPNGGTGAEGGAGGELAGGGGT